MVRATRAQPTRHRTEAPAALRLPTQPPQKETFGPKATSRGAAPGEVMCRRRRTAPAHILTVMTPARILAR